MNNIFVNFYNMFPNKIRNKIGKIKALTLFRDIILKKKGWYREVNVFIKRMYESYLVEFIFFASIKTAAKAYKVGIENTILKNSIKLIKKYKNINDNCLVLDIGSSFGYLSLVWAKSICKNQGRVIAFEPNYKVFNTFTKSIFTNGLNNLIINENCAIGAENKKITLFLNNSTSNVIKSKHSKKSVEINMRTIDSYFHSNSILKCDLIKIDVDGVELDILKGCIDTMNSFKPIFIVETNNDRRLIEFFDQNNYKVLDMKLNEYLTYDVLPLNIFCIPNN